MALEWITPEGLIGTKEEESEINEEVLFTPSDASTQILSSSLPSTITCTKKANEGKMVISGVLPTVSEDTTYYVTIRLTAIEDGVKKFADRYFEIKSLNKQIEWDQSSTYYLFGTENVDVDIDISEYLVGKNGNEVYTKMSGSLPENVILTENGKLVGGLTSYDLENSPYTISVGVFVNDVQIVENHDFTLEVMQATEDTAPYWVTESGTIGNGDKDKMCSCSVLAIDTNGTSSIIYRLANEYEIPSGENWQLPPGTSLDVNKGEISGVITTSQVTKWTFGVVARKYYNGTFIESDLRKFNITTNYVTDEHKITWGDETEFIDGGTFSVGSSVASKLPSATTEDGETITYEIVGSGIPAGLSLTSTGMITGVVDYPLDDDGNPAPSKIGSYYFTAKASTKYTYVIRTVKVTLTEGLNYNALKLYLRLNLEFKDEYNNIKNQLNVDQKYSNGTSIYTIDTFPKIDVATLKCFDREILASMMNYGNIETVRFLETRYKEHAKVDNEGNPVANYEVYYKPIDESTLQWDEIECGDYDFESKLQQLKDSGEIEQDTELDFNNTVYETNVYSDNIVTFVETKKELLSIGTTNLQEGYYAKVFYDESLPEPNTNTLQYYKWDGAEWIAAGTTLPHVLIKTNPSDSYSVFNFENVRKQLATPIYVYQKNGTYYYDKGSQQLLAIIEHTKNLYERDGSYYISDEDGTNEQSVTFESHIVKLGNEIVTNTLFKTTWYSYPFVVDTNMNWYYVDTITNPFCFDVDANKGTITIDTLPEGAEMVLPRISDADVSSIAGGGLYIQMLDTTVEPLPEWKRSEAREWEANTLYTIGEIIINESVYYYCKQQFTSGSTFKYDKNLLQILSNEEIDKYLMKNYFPTLDLGYFNTGTNRSYLLALNDAEINYGEFWYRKNFNFWELTCESMYNEDIENFGVPFVPVYNRLEDKERETKLREFEVRCTNVEDADITVSTTASSYIRISDTKIKVPDGSTVSYTVSKDGYFTVSNSYVIVNDEVVDVELSKICVFTLTPTPLTATVTLTASGYATVSGTGVQTITVKDGETVNYTVEKEADETHPYGYLQETGSKYMLEDESLSITLREMYKFSIDVIYPSDPTLYTIKLTASGYSQTDNYIIVPNKTTVTWVVSGSGTGYSTKNGYVRVTSTSTLEVSLANNTAVYVIDPTPSDATVTFNGSAILSQSGNSIIVEMGESFEVVVEKDGYETQTKSYAGITTDMTEEVTLKQYLGLTISTIPTDATVTLSSPAIYWAEGITFDRLDLVLYKSESATDYEYYYANVKHTSGSTFDSTKWTKVNRTIYVTEGSNVTYKVERVGYVTQSGVINMISTTSSTKTIILSSTGSLCPESTDLTLFCSEIGDNDIYQLESGTDL